MEIIYLLIGIGIILWGADIMTDGAVGIASRMGISELVIGLTVVAMGTSAPELFVSLMSAVDGAPGMAVGNVIGSNLFNILVIGGLSALVAPITVAKKTVNRDIALMTAASIVMLLLGLDDSLGRIDCIILFALFIVFIINTIRVANAGKITDGVKNKKVELPVWRAILYVLIGLACLVGGGKLFVMGATILAQKLGVSDAIIGLTVVAAGTSLPELATSLVAAARGKSDLAIGNVVGSCVFNILLILGLTGIISPLNMAGITVIDIVVMAVSPCVFWLFSHSKLKIERWEGAVLFLIYVGYIVYRIKTL